MALKDKNPKYKWEFENIGGTSRVRIGSGEDIAHLEDLDPKMWTVLSCPVQGLEIDEKSLSYIDTDADGKIRVNDVIAVSKWMTGALKNRDLLLEGKDHIDVNEFNLEDEAGKKLYSASNQILTNLGKEGTVVSLSDTADMAAIFANTRFNGDGVITETSTDDEGLKALIAAIIAATGGVADRSGAQGVNAALIEEFYAALSAYQAWNEAAVEAPFGEETDKVIAAYDALDAKVKDFFMRSRLAAFSPDSMAALDVQTSRIEAISSENLTGKNDEIAAYPLARVTGKAELDLTAPLNPAWEVHFEVLKSAVFTSDKKTVSEEEWKSLGAKSAAYVTWKSSKAGECVESLGLDTVKQYLQQNRMADLMAVVEQDAALAEESANIDMVDKFLHTLRDFYRLLRNFVTLHDFYSKDKEVRSIFQSGRLIIDQRECRFCMKVSDMPKHNTSAASSGMFLIYCDCTTKSKPGKLPIVAAVTTGETGDLIVGKNAVYYDNNGLEWDAVITKVIDNPISVAQAFWSPYRRMAKAVENLISKSAADKDAKMMSNATSKINAAPTSVPAAGADPSKPAAPPFDIAKFAGIFAAVGMAVGMIGTALVSLAKGVFALSWWQLILVFLGIMMLISGPSMIMAWLKLRRRNIAPLLNANGWAVNAASKVSIPFGETLTDTVKYPKMKLKDPYAKKGIAPWKAWLITLFVLAAVVCGLWMANLLDCMGFRSPLPRYNPIEIVGDVPVSQLTDSTAVLDSLAPPVAPAATPAE